LCAGRRKLRSISFLIDLFVTFSIKRKSKEEKTYQTENKIFLKATATFASAHPSLQQLVYHYAKVLIWEIEFVYL
jgi:hypothetical protein